MNLLSALPLLQLAGAIASPVDAVVLEQTLLAALHERFPAVVRWQVHAFGTTAEIRAGEISVARLGARSAVRVGGRVYWYAVAGYQTAISARRTVPAGESLSAHDGRAMETDVLTESCPPLTDITKLEGARAKHMLRADRVICADALEPRPAVARGDDITVHYVGARVSLTTTGVAETDGAVGDAVNVKNARTRELYRAEVSGVREVTIHE